jgi:hypothetical protein
VVWRRFRRWAPPVSALAVVVVTLSPATSHALIKFGSDLTPSVSNTAEDCILSTPPCTNLLTAVRAQNSFPVASPTSGTVVRFGIKSASADTVTFRLGQIASTFPAKGRGAGTGPTAKLPAPGTYSYSAAVHVHAGDFVGVDSSSVSAISTACGIGGGGFDIFHPTLVNGGSYQSPDSNSSCELLVNAVVHPSNRFTFLNPKINTRKGTARLPVILPGPGGLKLTGKGIKRASRSADRAGKVTLPIRPNARLRKRLIRRGSVRVRAEVTFKPQGGDPRTRSKRVKLVER